MKRRQFNIYVAQVCDVFGVSKYDIFTKTKKRSVVDARQMLYYICKNRPMPIVYIQKFMREEGYDVCHSPIIHGINVVQKKIDTDVDWREALVQSTRKGGANV
jgi:chromosomal replication initiation ATPase DnaA|tara:strand:+ start:1432 stop:1740 length:309 start_codon:yes stop_codon:yes gene_type:complete